MVANTRHAANTFASIELFQRLAPAALQDVMALANTRRLSKGYRIFDQGSPATRAHALIEGSVRVSQSGIDGAQIIVRFIRPGETFGTVGIFTDGRYPADAEALADSLEASWSKAELLDLIERHPPIAMNTIHIVGKRLQEVQERVRELSTQRVEQRVANAVLRLTRQAGYTTAAGTAIEIPLRRKDVADISGTTLHTASRILTAWEKAGWLVSENQHLTICKSSEISRIADGGPD